VSTLVTTVHDENVDRGVAFLDEKLGRSVWLPRLNFATLDISTCDRCVMCQATGIKWYGSALDSLGVTLEIMHAEMGGMGSWTVAHGFGLMIYGQQDWSGLTETWRRRVTELRAEVSK
jgi:hypothetical protein